MRLKLIVLLILTTLKALFGQADIIEMINDYRLSQGLSVLLEEEALRITAEEYVRTLVEQGYLSHTDLAGDRVLQRYRMQGGTSSSAGEILGSSLDRETLFQAWLDSPEHKKVIENPQWTRIGYGLIEQDCQIVSVVLFSRSTILDYSIEITDEELHLTVEPIDGVDLEITGGKGTLDSSGEYSFSPAELPLLLVINGGSDFLYLSDNFFK